MTNVIEFHIDTATQPLVTDMEQLFRYSGLVDSLRDTVRELATAGVPVERQTTRFIVDQYESLRLKVEAFLRTDLTAELHVIAPSLNRDTAELGTVLVALVQLARWADVCHQTPRFLIAEKAAHAGIRQAEDRITTVLAEASDSDTAAAPQRRGLYL